MTFNFSDPNEGILRLHISNSGLERDFFRERDDQLLTIAWNRGEQQNVFVDGVILSLRPNAIVPLMANQTFRFERAGDILAWQFNREFYCIVDHDVEVSCSGLLFYANTDVFALTTTDEQARRFELLTLVMQDEFGQKDRIQGEMLRSLLKRLIILLTRLTREQRMPKDLAERDVDLVRHFNVLVENHYKRLHKVKDYADLLHRSPKTLSNLFAKAGARTPLWTIHHRLEIEARRMLLFTDRPVKDIAYAIGFDDPALFARFFKQRTGSSPVDFRSTGLGWSGR